jgi:ABC-type bacteriocin/lantibiotic exporter with double-glycine peptidase domain
MQCNGKQSCPTCGDGWRRLVAASVLGLLGIGLIGLAMWSPETLVFQRSAGSRAGAVDCGPRCLQIVLQRFGMTPEFEEIAACSGLSEIGTSMLGLRDCARRYGLTAEGWRFVPQDLSKVPLPAIVYLDDRHFAVLDAVHPDRVELIDPGVGELSLPMSNFLRRWRGYTLVVEPLSR